jgi:putative ABC transport system ATP-binding protein
LSFSQSIRLLLARAVAGRPRLLVIDGVLDGLDDQTLDDIFQGLCRPGSGSTLLVITRRQDVAARCERTIVWPAPEAGGGGNERGVRAAGSGGH